MTILSNQEATLTAGTETLLIRVVFQKCRLTLTGIAGEFTTIPFRTKVNGVANSGLFEASEVELKLVQTLAGGSIFATTPAGVASLDIIYEIRTRRDV